MGLERRGSSGPYLYRKVREGRRVRSVYVASGPLALALYALDAAERNEGHRETSKGDPDAASLVDEAEAHFAGVARIAAAHLEALGYRRHKRGEWRRWRG